MRWLGVMAALVVAAPAQAQVTAQSLEIAKTVWHNPCAEVGIQVKRDLIYDDQGKVDTRSLARAYVDKDRETGRVTVCEITVSSLYRFSPAAFCAVAIHETGHLAGWRAPPGQEFIRLYMDGSGGVYGVPEPTHSNNPRKIMGPSLAEYREAHDGHPPPRCEQAFGRRFVWRRI